jgi:hypothetical protein
MAEVQMSGHGQSNAGKQLAEGVDDNGDVIMSDTLAPPQSNPKSNPVPPKSKSPVPPKSRSPVRPKSTSPVPPKAMSPIPPASKPTPPPKSRSASRSKAESPVPPKSKEGDPSFTFSISDGESELTELPPSPTPQARRPPAQARNKISLPKTVKGHRSGAKIPAVAEPIPGSKFVMKGTLQGTLHSNLRGPATMMLMEVTPVRFFLLHHEIFLPTVCTRSPRSHTRSNTSVSSQTLTRRHIISSRTRTL